MRNTFFLLCFFKILVSFSQEPKILPYPLIEKDSLYREDQFYAGMYFNTALNKPQGYSVGRLSPTFTVGFLRDMPINKARTYAIAPGLGFGYRKSLHNLTITQNISGNIYNTNVAYDRNKLEIITLDAPIEFRWRTSTPESHRFFRVYTGVKLSYTLYSKSVFQDTNQLVKIINNSDLNSFRTSAYIVLGYNTWNFFGSYGLTPLFKSSATIDNKNVGLNPLNFGIQFYIL
jgi:hypothetical protein